MPLDLRIRPLGRPKISKDSALGFQRIARRYVVEGPKVTKAGLDASPDGFDLFRPVGEPDEEFDDHYLVNQQIEPGKSMDKAYLTREYVEIRNTWSTESVTESGGIKRMTRKYSVLRSTSPVSLGYSTAAWANHPAQLSNDSHDPWDYLPSVIQSTEPLSVSYEDESPQVSLYASTNVRPSGLKPVSLGGVSLGSMLTGAGLSLKWLRASAQVDTSNPGVDLWTVSWAAPAAPYWSMGTGGKSSGGGVPDVLHFNTWGLKHIKAGQGGSAPQTAYSYTFFSTGVELPNAILTNTYGSITPTVSMDFYLVGLEGGHGSQRFKGTYPNAIYDKEGLQLDLHFPSQLHTDTEDEDHNITGSTGQPSGIANIKVAHGHTGYTANFIFKYPEVASADYTYPSGGYPVYQGNPIVKAGGHITWTVGYNSNSSYATLAKTTIAPIFSHNLEKIWKVTLLYIN